MRDVALAAGLSFACLGAFAVTGRLWWLAEEFDSRARQAAALALLWIILLACVFYPTVSPDNAADVDTAALWFPSIFLGHMLLTGFLIAWWFLARPQPVARFLALEQPPRRDDVCLGLRIGAFGWLAALLTSASVALLLHALGIGAFTGGDAGEPFEVPGVLLWLVDLPIARKLIVVAVAMTVEEAFYRAFLQRRVGWVTSSALFALSHAGYGLPTLTASVFTISLAIGWGLRRTGSLVPCVVGHGVFDAVQLLIVMPLAVGRLHPGG